MTGRRLSDYLLQRADKSIIWGDAEAEWARDPRALRLANLETAITDKPEQWPQKKFHFLMHPDNLGALQAAGFDALTLANNHIQDAGRVGLSDTLTHLRRAGIATVGAGADLAEASRPIRIRHSNGQTVLIFAWAGPGCFTPTAWAAGPTISGINRLPDYSWTTLKRVLKEIKAAREPGDIVVASIHWGPNFNYSVTPRQRWFARRLIDLGGVDVIHGHSAHHAMGIEIHRRRVILYGCGDCISDYEGVKRHSFRPDLAPQYHLELNDRGEFKALTLSLLQIKDRQLHHATSADVAWLCRTINGGGRRDEEERNGRRPWLNRRRFNTRWEPLAEGRISVVKR